MAVDVGVMQLDETRKRLAATPAKVFFFDVFFTEFSKLLEHCNAGQGEGESEALLSSISDVNFVTIDIGGNRNSKQVRRAIERCIEELPGLEILIVKCEELASEVIVPKCSASGVSPRNTKNTTPGTTDTEKGNTTLEDQKRSQKVRKVEGRGIPPELLETDAAVVNNSTNLQLKKKLRRNRKAHGPGGNTRLACE